MSPSVDGLEVVFPLVVSFVIFSTACLACTIASDANAREENGARSAFAAVVAAPFVLPLYAYYQHRRFLPRRSPPTRRERVAGTIGVGTGIAVIVTGVLTPPDPFTVLAVLPIAVVVALQLTRLSLSASRPFVWTSAE